MQRPRDSVMDMVAVDSELPRRRVGVGAKRVDCDGRGGQLGRGAHAAAVLLRVGPEPEVVAAVGAPDVAPAPVMPIEFGGDVADVYPFALRREIRGQGSRGEGLQGEQGPHLRLAGDEGGNVGLGHEGAVDKQLPVTEGVERLLQTHVDAQPWSGQVVVQRLVLAPEVGATAIGEVKVWVLDHLRYMLSRAGVKLEVRTEPYNKKRERGGEPRHP